MCRSPADALPGVVAQTAPRLAATRSEGSPGHGSRTRLLHLHRTAPVPLDHQASETFRKTTGQRGKGGLPEGSRPRVSTALPNRLEPFPS